MDNTTKSWSAGVMEQPQRQHGVETDRLFDCGSPSRRQQSSGRSSSVFGNWMAISTIHLRRLRRVDGLPNYARWVDGGHPAVGTRTHRVDSASTMRVPSFSLIRFETNGPAVWFKAVGEPNLREFPITLKLVPTCLPKYLPELLGGRADWNGWLSLEAPGTNLRETREIAVWQSAAESLARLQVESVAKTESILDAGAHDLRTETLSGLVQPFLAVIAQLMERQTKVPPPVLNHAELSLLGVRILDSLTLLGELGIPDALGHLDLNPGNIIVSADRCAFIDWAEAHVGHPFLSFEYSAWSISAARSVQMLRLKPDWNAPSAPRGGNCFRAKSIAEALTLAPLAAVFAYAVGNDAWKDHDRLKGEKVAGYFRSLARRMNREAMQFTDRSSPCLS